MPYIKQDRRDELGFDFSEQSAMPRSSGELNYMVTELMKAYLAHHGACYQTFNDIVGAVDGAKTEFERRVVAPYEDTKIKENGDVY